MSSLPVDRRYPWRVGLGFAISIMAFGGVMAVVMGVLWTPWTPPPLELAVELPVPPTVPRAVVRQSAQDPTLVAEVNEAYRRYSEIRAEAEWSLDGSRLAEVMPGPELAGSLRYLDDLRASGRAVRTKIEHNVRITRLTADEAEIVDDVTDWSVYVDATTRQPLQAEPAGRKLTEVYFLAKNDGVWKVIGEG